VYGVNSIGLVRNGFSQEVIVKLKRAYRYLLQSKLNTSQALARIEMDTSLNCPDVHYLVEFIKSSERGVSLRRSFRHHGRHFDDEIITDE
jgi:UDP-N-acetylglucosamine acyltransferase